MQQTDRIVDIFVLFLYMPEVLIRKFTDTAFFLFAAQYRGLYCIGLTVWKDNVFEVCQSQVSTPVILRYC